MVLAVFTEGRKDLGKSEEPRAQHGAFWLFHVNHVNRRSPRRLIMSQEAIGSPLSRISQYLIVDRIFA